MYLRSTLSGTALVLVLMDGEAPEDDDRVIQTRNQLHEMIMGVKDAGKSVYLTVENIKSERIKQFLDASLIHELLLNALRSFIVARDVGIYNDWHE